MKRSPLFGVLSWISIVLSTLNNIPIVHSKCNVCNTRINTACISETEYQQCENNQPFGTIYKCNEGYYCSDMGCVSTRTSRDCQQCGICDTNKVFACTGTQTFALCLGEVKPSKMTGQCSNGLKCNIEDAKICVPTASTCSFRDDSITTTEATTTNKTTATKPSPAEDPIAFCRLIQKAGRYPVGTNPQTTCRQYISCAKVGNTWYGPIYNCPGQTYFDSSRNSCVVNKPSICAGTTSSA